MNKIVLDTNVFVSALFSKNGASFALLEFAIERFEEGLVLNCISVPLALELEDVIFRKKNRVGYEYFSDGELKGFVDDIIHISNKTKLNFLWRPFLKDSGDDKVLETAFNAGAKYIITYNLDDFQNVTEYFDIAVITPRQYLQEVQK